MDNTGGNSTVNELHVSVLEEVPRVRQTELHTKFQAFAA